MWKCKHVASEATISPTSHLPVRVCVRAGPRRPSTHSGCRSQSTSGLLAFGIEPKPFRSVKQKHIKPCDSSLKSVKVYRALAQGAPARQVVLSQSTSGFKRTSNLCSAWLYSGDAFCDISSSRGENCVMPFLEIATNEGSVCDYLFECRCRSRPMRQSIAWLPLHLVSSPNHCIQWNKNISSPVTAVWNKQKFTELWTKEYLFAAWIGRWRRRSPHKEVGCVCVYFDVCYISTFVHCTFNARFFH